MISHGQAVVYRDMDPINNMNLQAGGGRDIRPLPLTRFRVRCMTHTLTHARTHKRRADKQPWLL